ncbi:putative mitochondrial phosphate carrier protein Pic2/Mir1 [Helianthus debilis subsp. tardiflorus]
MAVSDNSRQSLIPNFLYTSSISPSTLMSNTSNPTLFSSPSLAKVHNNFVIPAPNEPLGKIEMYSPRLYAACTVGGILSCGLTPWLLFLLILLNVTCSNIDPVKYKSISSGFGVLLKEQGMRGFFRGWVRTLLGYSAQGACKFGFYEFFKKYYSVIVGPEYAAKYKTLIYLAGSASAEVIADVALCPMEAMSREGTCPNTTWFCQKVCQIGRVYKGLVPLWGRQIPCKLRHLRCNIFLLMSLSSFYSFCFFLKILFMFQNNCRHSILLFRRSNSINQSIIPSKIPQIEKLFVGSGEGGM